MSPCFYFLLPLDHISSKKKNVVANAIIYSFIHTHAKFFSLMYHFIMQHEGKIRCIRYSSIITARINIVNDPLLYVLKVGY